MIIIIIFITLLVNLLHYQSIITLPVDVLHYRSIITLPVDYYITGRLLHYRSIITLLVYVNANHEETVLNYLGLRAQGDGAYATDMKYRTDVAVGRFTPLWCTWKDSGLQRNMKARLTWSRSSQHEGTPV